MTTRSITVEDVLAKLSKVKSLGPDSWQACCPAHQDSNPSMIVSRGRIHPVVFHCYAGCTPEDILGAIGISYNDICKEARIPSELRNRVKDAAKGRTILPPAPVTEDQNKANLRPPTPVLPEETQTNGLCTDEYLYHDEDGILLYKKFRYQGSKGKYFKFARPLQDDQWATGKGCMEGVRRVLYNLPAVRQAVEIFIVEGEKCANALNALGLVATTNDDGASSHWPDAFSDLLSDKDVIILPDEDEPGVKHAENILASLKGKCSSYRVVRLPGLGIKPAPNDIADWLEQGHTRDELLDEIRKVEPYPPQLSVLSVLEIIAIDLPNSDNMMGDRVLSEGEILGLVGPGGIGKSRLLLQLMISLITGQNWGNLSVRTKNARCLMFQTENNVRRLQNDLMRMLSVLPDDKQEAILDNLRILCPIRMEDRDLSLSAPESEQRMKTTVRKFRPNVVFFDPLVDFFDGDNENDSMQMKSTLFKMRRIIMAHNPKTAGVVVHHSGLGKAAVAGAMGLDRATYGRGAKSFFNTLRSIVNVLPGAETENPPLIITCGKNNNGRMFKRWALKLNEDTRLYQVDEDFDFESYADAITTKPGFKKRQPKVTPNAIRLVLQSQGHTSTFNKIILGIMDVSSCGRSTAIEALKKAVNDGIVWNVAGIYSIRKEPIKQSDIIEELEGASA